MPWRWAAAWRTASTSPLGVEPGWCLAGWEVLEGGHVLLDDGGGGQDGPELLAGIQRVGGGVHVLFDGVGAEVDRAGHGGANNRRMTGLSLG